MGRYDALVDLLIEVAKDGKKKWIPTLFLLVYLTAMSIYHRMIWKVYSEAAMN